MSVRITDHVEVVFVREQGIGGPDQAVEHIQQSRPATMQNDCELAGM